jgi:hypothetical protein
VRAGGYYQGRNLFANLDSLIALWEQEEQVELELPGIGRFNAVATTWSRDFDVKLQSGEVCEVTFKEDQDQALLLAQTLSKKPIASLATGLGDLEARTPIPPVPAWQQMLDQIRDGVNTALAYRDTAEMWSDFIITKIEGLLALFSEADEMALFNDPLNSELLGALHALWAATQEVVSQAGELGSYTTTRDTDVAGVSMAIYGDTAHQVDIMNLNPIEDPYRIRAGTTLRYLKTE